MLARQLKMLMITKQAVTEASCALLCPAQAQACQGPTNAAVACRHSVGSLWTQSRQATSRLL